MTSSDTGNRIVSYENSEKFAQLMDKRDPLSAMREEFLMPVDADGNPLIYMAGNSLGLQPSKVRSYIDQELMDWANLGVEGHFQAQNPWLPYHENLTESTARLVGALPREVVVMNSLTVNLHLMMLSFYRPTRQRYKILIEGSAFPSDQYAVASQVKLHGLDPAEAVIEVIPREGEDTLRTEDIQALLESEGETIALIMMGNCNYLTGQAFDMQAIARIGHEYGCYVAFNLAHGAGNLELKLHQWNVDFAVWCSYKYLNAGPGGIAGCFVHEKHAEQFDWPRLAGWWGHDKATRFLMGPVFNPIAGAEGWQLSNPPIFQLAALRASMQLFDQAGMSALRKKSELLTGYLEFLLNSIPNEACRIITPKNPLERGCQLSVRINHEGKDIVGRLKELGAICDFREPDIMRVAPAPLYTSFTDVWRFCALLSEALNTSASIAPAVPSVSAPPVSTLQETIAAPPAVPATASAQAPASDGDLVSSRGAVQSAERAAPVVARPATVAAVKSPASHESSTGAAPGRAADGATSSASQPDTDCSTPTSSLSAAETPPQEAPQVVPKVFRASDVKAERSAERSSTAPPPEFTGNKDATPGQREVAGEKPTPVIRVPQRKKTVGDLSPPDINAEDEANAETEEALPHTVKSDSDTTRGGEQ